MKRSPELRSLSEEHHHGLVAARRLRLAAQGKAPLEEAIEGFLTAWRTEIQPHFRAEEEILLPEFARAVAPDDPLILRALAEHVSLRRAVRELQGADEAPRTLAAEIGQALDDHIRFEERVLFPAIESGLAGSDLAALGRELKERERDDGGR
jgi:iron-sulfur cluster repair protein YtfE (RIC family)